MAKKSYTRPELERLNKPELQNIATDLGVQISGLTKSQLCDVICDVISGAKLKGDNYTVSEGESHTDDREGITRHQVSPVQC